VSLLLGLLFRLTTLILTPLYNTTPLALHVLPLYTSLALLPTILAAVVFGFFALPIGDTIDPRACLTVIAISSDLVVISARPLGSISGALFGPRLGAFASRWLLGIGAICGGCAFTILCLVGLLTFWPSATWAYISTWPFPWDLRRQERAEYYERLLPPLAALSSPRTSTTPNACGIEYCLAQRSSPPTVLRNR
jgi:hypothetical protein